MTPQLVQGFELLLAGMGVVFAFLILLVATTTIMSRTVNRLFPEPEPVAPATPAASVTQQQEVPAHTVAVIQAAIDQHRNR